MNEVHTLWLFIPGGIFLTWGVVMAIMTNMSSKALKMMRPSDAGYDPEFENRKSIIRNAALSLGAAANRHILFGLSLIFMGMAFS